MTVAELIRALGGELVAGDAGVSLSGVAAVARASRGSLVFAEEDADSALASGAGCVVLRRLDVAAPAGVAVVVAEQPRLWFALAAKLLRPVEAAGVHASAVIADDAAIGSGVSIGAGAVIGAGVRVGAGSVIHPRVVVYPGVVIGERVVVHAGAVLGADGFGYVRDRRTGRYTQFPQWGGLVIEDDVEIGANATVDRGALETTIIRRGAKLDNLVHVGHNCDVGEDVVIAAQVGISGSCSIGNGAVIAGQVGIGDHAHVGPGVILGGQAGVLPNKRLTTTGMVLWGTPARPLKEYLRELATLARLAKRK